ncbi:MAG TPA: signal peptidase II [Mycobacteriales bacterium]|nr:signal peptidase II [Mycobacteriales bacterium]
MRPDGTPDPEPDPGPSSAVRRVALLLSAAGSTLALDVLTKLWVVERLRDDTVRLLGGALLLRQSRNPGAAFGIAGGATVVFSLVAIVVVLVILRVAPRLRSRGWAVALGCVLGGALGNLIDRVFRAPSPLRGEVVDFLDFQVWPSFNIADSGIVVGGALAVFLSFRGIEPTGAATADVDSSDT